MYYTSSRLPESGGHLLITSLTHNKKTVPSSSIDIVLQCNLTEHVSLIYLFYTVISKQYKHHNVDIHLIDLD